MPFEVPRRVGEAAPDSARVARIRKAFAESATPVRPLPSNAALMLACTGVFIVLTILFAVPLGLPGFLTMSATARVVVYTAIFLLAMVLAGGVVAQMIPGSRRVLRPGTAALAAILLLCLTVAVQFPDFRMENFVGRGIPCLSVGVICAIPAGALIFVLMRSGFLTDTIGAGVAAGTLAGLLGVAVLALHCPILNAAHIIVWHLGAMLVASIAGAALARVLRS